MVIWSWKIKWSENSFNPFSRVVLTRFWPFQIYKFRFEIEWQWVWYRFEIQLCETLIFGNFFRPVESWVHIFFHRDGKLVAKPHHVKAAMRSVLPKISYAEVVRLRRQNTSKTNRSARSSKPSIINEEWFYT